jgi:18S rRNA (guanine1575-N7)-methyltransferase
MSERAIELLALSDDEPHFLLDLGCGSGLSGSVLEEQGHAWVGVDISSAMLGMFFMLYVVVTCEVCILSLKVN